MPSLIGFFLLIWLNQTYWQPLQLERAKGYFLDHTHDLLNLAGSDIIYDLMNRDAGPHSFGFDRLESAFDNRWQNVTVYKDSGQRLYPVFKYHLKSALDDSNFIHIIYPLEFEGKPLGRLELDIDWGQAKQSVIKQVKDIRNIIISLMIMVLLLGALSQYYFIYIPLKKLNSAARHITQGDFTAELPPANNDEIGQLTDSFRTMMSELEFHKNALDQHAIVSVTDKSGSIIYTNNKFLTISGYTRKELIGNSHRVIKSYIHPPAFYREMWLTISQGKTWHGEVCNLIKTGEQYWVNSTIVPFLDSSGVPERYMSIHTNITEQKKIESSLKLAASVFTNAREGIIITDTTPSIIEVNDSFTKITGYSAKEAIGQNPGSILSSGNHSAEFYATMRQEINSRGHWNGEISNRHKNGDLYTEKITISGVKNSVGTVSHYVALFTDITQIKAHQGQLERMANYDMLTNLPNRILLADRLGQAIVQSHRHHHLLAVLFLDLDGFKAVNDTYGHNVGDQLLVIVSQRMKEALREGDTLARIGGDEFVVVLTELDDVQACYPILERLLRSVADPITIAGNVLNISASIGVALCPRDGEDADILIRHADQAMYQAKKSGKNCYHLFDTLQDNAVNIRQDNLISIREAFDRREFVLYYQPKVNIATGDVVGVEALIRWQHPVRGLVPPLEFLPDIEGHAISIEVGEWVIDTALCQISQWQHMGLTLPISVNISAYQLQQNNFAIRMADLLAAHPEVNPCHLELEVLETSALSDTSQVSATMQTCRELGVSFSLDDFGTGYSSLTYLRRLPVNIIKIDQSFVRDMLIDPDDLTIVKSVIGLAKSFKHEVIAEGVETLEHGITLLKLGCYLAQGYGIARPMPASDIPAWVEGGFEIQQYKNVVSNTQSTS